jgi:hypothetical protein
MFIIECLDSDYNTSNILNNTEDLIFLDKEKIIIISDNYIEIIKQKIILLYIMLDSITNESIPIIIPFKNINYNDMKFVINFIKIDNDIINNFFKDLNKNDQYVSSINTKNMPKMLIDFFDDYTIINTINISELIDIELDYNKLKYLEKITQIADFLQYDLLCDALQYKYADNIRIINKDLLKLFMKNKLLNLDEINKIYDYINNNDCESHNIIDFLDEITIIDYQMLQKFINNKPSKDIIIEEIISKVLYDLDQLY